MHATRAVVYSIVDIGFSVRFFEKDERSAFHELRNNQRLSERMHDEFKEGNDS